MNWLHGDNHGTGKNMTKKTLTFWTTCLALLPLTVLAQETKIESHVISGGGGTSSAGNVVLTGTIGQPVAGLSSGGDYQLKAGFWGIFLDVVVVPDESFAAWMENLPESEKPPEGERGPQDTPAGDGMTNLLKYALGLMPMTPSADAVPKVFLEDGFLTIALGRSQMAAVAFKVEGSLDLTTWTNVPFNEQIVDADIGSSRERVHLLTGLNQHDNPKYFLRLRVTRP
jgi:hypothetical protein